MGDLEEADRPETDPEQPRRFLPGASDLRGRPDRTHRRSLHDRSDRRESRSRRGDLMGNPTIVTREKLDQMLATKCEVLTPHLTMGERIAFLFFANGCSWTVAGWGILSWGEDGHQVGLKQNDALEFRQITGMRDGLAMAGEGELFHEVFDPIREAYAEKYLPTVFARQQAAEAAKTESCEVI